ncbi:GntR family transcriptional regulator [Micrococcus sp. HG099]|uniref:FadR/GntR family transcriptional regulator n=1 Tax=Micrococcus sp. HG099 TaxID=2969755 RepID=UPI00215B3DB0|nr:GntR family transcriptional regulator [Micrococcus sp. HG099]MCR8674565.1 GntR family transcriptional regulator [Micrococcus sp. HG099]
MRPSATSDHAPRRASTSTRTRSRSDLVADALRERIVAGQLNPGARLPTEQALQDEHGVSRTVVREALTRLQTEGLVYTRRGSGSFVLAPPGLDSEASEGGGMPARTDDREDVLVYRMAIETEAASRAALRALGPSAETGEGHAVMTSLRQSAEAFTAAAADPATRPSDLMRLDFHFHRAVASAAGSALLVSALEAMGPAMITMPPDRLTHEAAVERRRLVAWEHGAVLDAVCAGDAVAAAAAMRAHLHNSARRLRAGATG